MHDIHPIGAFPSAISGEFGDGLDGVRNLEGQGAGEEVPAGVRGTAADAGGCDVEVRAWGEGTGPLLYTATLTAKNGRKVNGMGYTPEGAEEDAMKCWMRGEG